VVADLPSGHPQGLLAPVRPEEPTLNEVEWVQQVARQVEIQILFKLVMGMDLEGPGRYFRWNNRPWYDLLELAKEFGWVPTGTGPPRGTRKAQWRHGSYYNNDGQRVYARDAAALADALERALAATPKRSPRRRRYRAAQGPDSVEALLTGSRKPGKGKVLVRDPRAEDSGSIRRFIRFCRAGSFRLF
jgi:hypothetical protein